MPTDPDYGVHDSRTPPEVLLIFSILSRAILDLFGSVGLTSNHDEANVAKHDALMFLTQISGGWAKRRNELCDAVGIDSDELRDRVVCVLEGDMIALDTYETRGAMTQVAEARKLWEFEKSATERARVASITAKQQRECNRQIAAKTKYAKTRQMILALLEIPKTVNELVEATGITDGAVRTVLNKAESNGELQKTQYTYVLASVPQTAVAATTG